MKIFFRELSFRVRILLLLTGLLLLVNLPLFYLNSISLQIDHDEVSRSQSFRYEMTKLLSRLSEWEERHKKFLLTPSVQNQNEYGRSVESVKNEFIVLKASTVENPSRQAVVKELERRMNPNEISKIREKVEEISYDENLLMLDRQKTIEQKRLSFRFLLLGLGFLDVGVLLFTILALRNEYSSQLGFGKKLQDLQTRYRTIVDNAPVIFWALAKDQKFTVFEGKGLEPIGFLNGDVVGKKYDEIFQDVQGVAALAKALQGECVKKDILVQGRWFETVYVPDFQHGSMTGIVGISLDITDRKRSEEEARKSSEAKSRFLANMSHEIRTPIGIISGFADLALLANISESEKTNFILKIKKNSELLIDLVTDILDLSKIEAGKLETENREQDFHDFLNEIHEIFSFKCQEKGISFLLEIGSPLPKNITTDPMRLRQILMNLLSNALKFTKDGFVKVSVDSSFMSANSVDLRFFIEDSGIGMTVDQIEKTFKPFSQVDSSMSRIYGGTGLGLALSKKLAVSLNGDLSLISSHPGRGSVFGLNVLCSTKSRERFNHLETSIRALKAPEPYLPRLVGMKILLVEDSLDNQYLVKKILKAEGAEVTVASDGNEGVDAASKDDFNVILMDIQMPKMDGFEATHILRKKGYKKCIIALTANALKEEKDRALIEGFNAYLTKPLHRQLLIKSLEESQNINV